MLSLEFFELFLEIFSIDCCTSLISSTIILQIHTKLLLQVKLSLQRNIFCVSFDNKIQKGCLVTYDSIYMYRQYWK